jgi:DNA N-6-adenine-methyltransferase (Dam)
MSEISARYKAIATSSKSNEHYTPNQIIDAVLECFGGQIALDPCSNDRTNPNVPAERLFTLKDDGLNQDWVATSLYCNPPYSGTAAWTTKLVGHVKSGDVREAIALTKADNRTRWFADLMNACSGFCLYKGYLRFGDASGSAPFPSALFYFGDRFDNFDRTFSDLGWVFPRRSPASNQTDRLLIALGVEEFLDYMLRGGQYTAIDERTITLATSLKNHKEELEFAGINLSYYDCPTRTVGNLLRWYGHKLSRHQVRANDERLWVYKLKTVSPMIGDKKKPIRLG